MRFFFFQAEDGIRDAQESRGLGDVYKRQGLGRHVRVQVYKRFGYFPTESSEHFAEYVPWFMRDEAEIERLRIPVGEYVRRSEENLEMYAEEKRMLAAGEPFEICLLYT